MDYVCKEKKRRNNMIGLAPVDGITDGAFRQVVDEIGKPDVMYTEFITTEGLFRGRETLLHALDKHKTTTPIIAQFFGGNPKYYSYAFFIAVELGFAGVDVNMGCPDTNIVKKGGGAALLLDFPRAKKIIQTLLQARQEWKNGKRLVDTDLPGNMQLTVSQMKKLQRPIGNCRGCQGQIPISVKTRLGYHTSQVNEFIPFLIETGIDQISLHGRTVDKPFSGKVDWEEIAHAKELTKGTGVALLGDGDIKNVSDAKEKIKIYGVDGVLIARAAFGNPWIFANYIPTFKERKKAMLYHTKLFLKYRPDLDLRPMRKHLSWYCKGVEGSAKLRDRLMRVVDLRDLKTVLAS